MTHAGSELALRQAGTHLQQRDAAGAVRVLDRAIAADPHFHPLYAFAGLAACQAGDLGAGTAYLRHALTLSPEDRASRANLAFALLEQGLDNEAEAVAVQGDTDDPRLARVLAHLHQKQEKNAEAASAYARVVAAFPADFESWNNLGNARAAVGENDTALQAYQRAIELRPAEVQPRLNAVRVLIQLGLDEERRRILRDGVALVGDEAELQYELGVAEVAMREFSRAERAFRAALTLDPGFSPAYFDLGLLFDTLNELDSLRDLISFAKLRGLATPEITFLKAWEMKRRGAFAEALPLAESLGDDINQVRRYQLLGDIHDRLGDPDRAFAAYAAMNVEASNATSDAIRAEAAAFLAEVRAGAALVTPDQTARWSPSVRMGIPPAPIFLAGFPRSGTTLLDTLLMGVPRLHVLEEQPMMRAPEAALGDIRRLAKLSENEIAELRALYFEALDSISPPPPGSIVVDKFPLHMARMPLIHRLFPDAKIIFAQRHPCDSLLSCFFSNFQPNRAMTHFQTLEGAATLYDAVFDAWTRASDCLPLGVHVVRYESVVENLEGEMRSLLDFLDMPWDARVLDHRASAANRGHIKTASYAQVGEPIYRRSSGRWERYREHLVPVLPILRPWAERMGYDI